MRERASCTADEGERAAAAAPTAAQAVSEIPSTAQSFQFRTREEMQHKQ